MAKIQALFFFFWKACNFYPLPLKSTDYRLIMNQYMLFMISQLVVDGASKFDVVALCSSLLLDAVTKLTKVHWEKRIYFNLNATVYQGKAKKQFKAAICRQELKQSPWRSTTYWLPSPGLLSQISYTIQVCLLRNMTAHSGLGPSTSISN